MRVNATWRQRLSTSKSTGGKWGIYLMAALGALAGVHLVWQVLFGSPTDVTAVARTAVNKAAVVSSFAQDYVSVWLTATAQDTASLAQFVSLPSNDMALPPTPAVVITSPTVVAATYEGVSGRDGQSELWSVVVGVTQRAWESAPPDRALYRVPVLWSRFGPRAASLPARIGGPGPGADLPTAYPATPGPSDPVFTMVSGFVTAYLTSAGAVDRYVTADSLITGLGDAYQSVTVMSLRAAQQPAAKPVDGQTVQVLAEVDALTAQYAHVYLSYPLTLRGVGGGWSVAAIDPVPVLAHDDAPAPIDNSHG
jgi:hypothetical protein